MVLQQKNPYRDKVVNFGNLDFKGSWGIFSPCASLPTEDLFYVIASFLA